MGTEYPRHPKKMKKARDKLSAEIAVLEKEINKLEILLDRAEKKRDLREQKLGYLTGEGNLYLTLMFTEKDYTGSALEGKE